MKIRNITIRLTLVVLAVSISLSSVAKERLKVGLALGGGGAKGAAEVGVLKVLEQANIPVDYIAGTSIGAIIGCLYATGHRADELDSLFRTQEWIDLLADRDKLYNDKPVFKNDSVTYVFGIPVHRKKKEKGKITIGAVHGNNIIDLISSMTVGHDSIDFATLPIPFKCVASDIRSFEEVVIDKGDLPLAVRASMSIPGAFKPVQIDGHLLVDGGMFNNLPVDVVRDMGADIVIAIDLTQHKHKNRKHSLKSELGIGGLADWLVSRPDWTKYNANRAAADLYFNPDLTHYGVTSFNRKSIADMIAIGEETANKQLKEIKKIKKMILKGKRQHIKTKHIEQTNSADSK